MDERSVAGSREHTTMLSSPFLNFWQVVVVELIISHLHSNHVYIGRRNGCVTNQVLIVGEKHADPRVGETGELEVDIVSVKVPT